jgi:hypothetical protein
MAILEGKVLDPNGNPVSGARIFVASAPASMPDIALVSDEFGHFVMSLSIFGLYRIGARDDRWGNVFRQLKIYRQNTTITMQFQPNILD